MYQIGKLKQELQLVQWFCEEYRFFDSYITLVNDDSNFTIASVLVQV